MLKHPLFANAASSFAPKFDEIFFVLTALSVFFTVLVFSMIVIFAIRYRAASKVERGKPITHNTKLEIIIIGFLSVVGLGVFFWSAKPYATIYGAPPANAQKIYVIGKQWMWEIQHPDGIRENDALHLPLGRPVQLILISQDVIHSFFVPAFKVKRDVVPGMYNSVWFIPTKLGKFRLFCAQYCGAFHSQMTGWVTVMKPRDFAAWEAAGGSSGMPVNSMADMGQALFKKYGCVSCHGVSTGMAPSLAGLYMSKVHLTSGATAIANDAYIREAILDPSAHVPVGYQPIMPVFKDQLNEEQVLDLIAYIKSLSNNDTPQPSSGSSKGAETDTKSTGNTK